MDSEETKVALLIDAVRNLSTISADNNKLLTKLLDDHESRLRGLEKMSQTIIQTADVEKRLRALENWRWYIIGMMAALVLVLRYWK